MKSEIDLIQKFRPNHCEEKQQEEKKVQRAEHFLSATATK